MPDDNGFIYIMDGDEDTQTGGTSEDRNPVLDEQSEPGDADNATATGEAAVGSPTVEYTRPDYLRLSGATAPNGDPWIKVEVDDDDRPGGQASRSVWIPLADWLGDGSGARRRLTAARIIITPEDFRKKAYYALITREFPALPLIERPGWTGPHYALPSGEVFSPEGAEPAVVLFERDVYRCAMKGSLEGWLEGVARLAKGQSIVTFVLMVSFVPALLKLSTVMFNPGFELTGPKRRGKSTLQQLMASILGPAVEQHGRNYLITANATVNALEGPTQSHADLPLIIDEMGLYYAGETEKTRSQKMRELVMRLAEGDGKARLNETPPPKVRLAYLTSANETLTSMFGERLTWALSATGDRLLTIPIGEDRQFGIFDKLPKGCASSREAIVAIVDLIKNHHGCPIRAYLQGLVADRAASEPALRARITALTDQFREAVGVDDDIGPESSIADVFGLVYAAGMLAQAYGALPAKLKLLRAVVAVYRLNREISSPPPTNLERLQSLADRRGVIKVDAANLRDIPDGELDKAPALLRTSRAGSVELLMTDAQLARAFVVPSRALKDPEVKDVMRTDRDGRKKVSVTIRTNRKQERLYAFALGSNADGTRS